MAKKRKKTGAPVPGTITRKTWKDTCRRIIRIVMVVLGVFLLLVAFGIPVVNNAIALGVEKDMKALPLPEDTQLVESSSVAGKLVGNGNGMQYFGALLLESKLSASELSAFYNNGMDNVLFGGYTVVSYTGKDISDNVVKNLPLTRDVKGENHYVVYYCDGGYPLQGWLDLDLRGH